MVDITKSPLLENIEERIQFHIEMMDKYALSHLRAAAQIEFILTQGLEANFANTISVQKVTGDSFARVIHLSYALGIIHQKTYESLQKFKDIRNRIAHKVEPDIKLVDTLGMLKFLGSEAESEVQKRSSYLAECHNVALDLLIERVKDEVLA